MAQRHARADRAAFAARGAHPPTRGRRRPPRRRRRRRSAGRRARLPAPPVPPAPPVAWTAAPPPWKFWFEVGSPAETREPEAVIADVRASLVETLLAADAAALAGLGADERVTVAVDFVAGGLFVANARPSHTLLVSVRGRDVAAAPAARSAPRSCAGGSRSASTEQHEREQRERAVVRRRTAGTIAGDRSRSGRRGRRGRRAPSRRRRPTRSSRAAPRASAGGPEVAARERQREDAVEPRVDERHGQRRAEEPRERAAPPRASRLRAAAS